MPHLGLVSKWESQCRVHFRSIRQSLCSRQSVNHPVIINQLGYILLRSEMYLPIDNVMPSNGRVDERHIGCWYLGIAQQGTGLVFHHSQLHIPNSSNSYFQYRSSTEIVIAYLERRCGESVPKEDTSQRF
jgi:hypothetical protein